MVVPTSVYAASADWGTATTGSALAGRIDRAGAELAALMKQTGSTGPIDPFADPVSFVDLLGA